MPANWMVAGTPPTVIVTGSSGAGGFFTTDVVGAAPVINGGVTSPSPVAKIFQQHRGRHRSPRGPDFRGHPPSPKPPEPSVKPQGKYATWKLLVIPRMAVPAPSHTDHRIFNCPGRTSAAAPRSR